MRKRPVLFLLFIGGLAPVHLASAQMRPTGDVPGFSPDKLSNTEVFDFGLVPPKTGRARFQVPDLGNLLISFTPVMKHMQFWSQPGNDFICLEPFFGPNNTVNTDKRMDIPPGQSRNFWMKIELES